MKNTDTPQTLENLAPSNPKAGRTANPALAHLLIRQRSLPVARTNLALGETSPKQCRCQSCERAPPNHHIEMLPGQLANVLFLGTLHTVAVENAREIRLHPNTHLKSSGTQNRNTGCSGVCGQGYLLRHPVQLFRWRNVGYVYTSYTKQTYQLNRVVDEKLLEGSRHDAVLSFARLEVKDNRVAVTC